MTEAACLGRSFSSPSTSREAKEGDPFRALGESVSFGRFMSDSLAWEKWSVFSHDRYREEAEKISKPGSVAQLKTFFEAHYKKRAEERRAAAALLETAKAVSTNGVDLVTQNQSQVYVDEQKEQMDEQKEEALPNRNKAEERMSCEQSRKWDNVHPENKKVVEDLVDKKSVKSLHMSVHFSSHAVERNKRTSPVIQKIRSSKIFTSFNMSKNNSSSSQTRASVSGILKRPSVNLKSEDRSTKPDLNKSVAGGITPDRKWNCPSTDNLKSSGGKGSKPRSPTISFPFSFRSEERAAKRKEFFQKLEEKRNVEEMNHPQTRYQEKPMQGVKKARRSTSLKPRTNEDLRAGSQLPSSHMKKNLVARPRSPMLGRRATHSKIPDASSRLSTNTKSSKCVENNRSTNRFASSRHENASPNIQSPALKR